MSEQAATSNAQSMPGGVRLGAIVGVCVINLAILGYALKVSMPGQSHKTAPSTAQPVAQQPAPAPVQPAEPPPPAVVTPINLPDSAVIKGAYVQHCSACHGMDGRGEGPAADQLYPRPRDFVDSPFRFASTGGAKEQMIAGLERTISVGVPRSAMPGFGGVLEEPMIAGLARYVLSLRSAGQPAPPTGEVDVGTKPPTTPGLVARGVELYQSVGCVTCHGRSGHGDGEQARQLVDSIGRPVRPADLASGVFKSGQNAEDLVRTILKGVPGTPMIAYEDAVVRQSPDGSRDLTDAWALAAYIQSLQPREQPVGETSGAELLVTAAPDEAMLFDPAHVGWIGIEPTHVELRPLWQRIEHITHVDVRLVRTADQIAICLDWRDPTPDLGRDHATFPDAAAVMFALGPDVPALPMGVQIPGFQPEKPVNLWHWKANRQERAATHGAFVAHTQSPETQARWRLYGLPPQEALTQPDRTQSHAPGLPSFLTARDVGNIHEAPNLETYAILESNAEGFGTLTLQPPGDQHVQGVAAWSNGLWRIVMVRSIEPDDDMDVNFSEPGRIPVTFAVWDGSKGDRDGVKLISGWHWLRTQDRTGD